MKKVFIIGAVVLFAAGIFTTSCNDDSNPISCTQTAIELAAAAQAYSSDPSSANCTEYKNLINDYLDCDIAQVAKEEYQAILDGLDC